MFAMQLTSQFPHCGNAFRLDLYKKCSFGCVYCFSQARGGNYVMKDESITEEQFQKMEKFLFKTAKTSSVVHEMMQNRVPIHCGGMSDPFQPREFVEKKTLRALTLLKEYPVMFSTKTAKIPEHYFDILNPEYHAFQISCSGFSDSKIRDYEKATPLTSERLSFARNLKDRGFCVFIRIQPLISIEWAESILESVGDIVDGITIEHLKIPDDNHKKYSSLCGLLSREGISFQFHHSGREYEFPTEIKEKNILKLKNMNKKCKILVGDNDLRLLSDSINCCGLELCPDSFKNWIKCNSMTIKMTGNDNAWHPATPVKSRGDFGYGLNSECMNPKLNYMDYVQKNYNQRYGDPNQITMF